MKPQYTNQLLTILRMIQRQIESDCAFETILMQQAKNNHKNVNLVKTLAYAFIDMIRGL